MKLTEQEKKKLKGLAKSTKGTFLIEYLQKVKDDVADIRSKLNVKPELEKDVRLGICDAIDELLIGPLQRHAEEPVRPEDNWN